MSRTSLLLEYYERTKSYVLPDHIEEALENYYVRNPDMYTAHILKCIQVLFLIAPILKMTAAISGYSLFSGLFLGRPFLAYPLPGT